MKRKTLFLLSILTISATILSGCKAADSVENSETFESEATEETEESKVELEIAVPNTETISEDVASKIECLPWIQLSSLETHPELRTAFEELPKKMMEQRAV